MTFSKKGEGSMPVRGAPAIPDSCSNPWQVPPMPPTLKDHRPQKNYPVFYMVAAIEQNEIDKNDYPDFS
jgi:hypothetical protein